MYKVFLKGVNVPVEVKKEEAKIINEQLRNYGKTKADKLIELGSSTFWLSQVKVVMEVENSRADTGKEGYEYEILKHEYQKLINNFRIRQRSLVERAKTMPDWEAGFFAFVGRKPSDEEKEDMRVMRLEFFVENPDQAIAPFFIAKDYINHRPHRREHFDKDKIGKEFPILLGKLLGVSARESRSLSKYSLDQVGEMAKEAKRRMDESFVLTKDAALREFLGL